MSYQFKDLSVLAYANGFTLWHYTTAEATEALTQGHFDPAADMLRPGDIILANTAMGAGMPPRAALLLVAAVDGGVRLQPLMASPQPAPIEG